MEVSKKGYPVPGAFKAGSMVSRIIILVIGFVVFAGFSTWFVTGVVTELRFNEGTGTNAADLSGNNHPGTLVNGPTWIAGKQGQAVNLDGNNDYINLADHPNFTLTANQNYTWSTWVRPNNFNEWGTVWSHTLDNSNFFYFYTHSSGDEEAGPVTNGISVYWYSGAGKLVLHSNNNVLTSGQWNYVAVTYNASVAQPLRFTIYVNGVDVTDRSDVVSQGAIVNIDPNNIRIGANAPFGENLNAGIDDARYYRRLLSIAEIQADMNAASGPDTQAPTVSLSSPAAGSVTGTINVSANAADNTGVTGVQFLLDGVNLDVEDTQAPYSITWNTANTTNGSHTLTARARDAAGNTTTSQPVVVTVGNDATAPTVSITTPGATVNGTVNLSATASDNIAVVGVQFLVDGNSVGTEDTQAPYTVSWNTATVSNGVHNITARARDASGNTATSSAVQFTVNNDVQAPTITISGPAGPVSGTINVSATVSDNIGVVGVQFLVDGANHGTELTGPPYSTSVNTMTLGNGQHSIMAKARDAAGNSTTSSAILINVGNDQQPPTAAVQAPTSTPVSGTVTLIASTSDNVGVAGVQFMLDGVNIGTEDLSPPFTYSWITLAVTNGLHYITAKARDAAGNTTTSAPVAFNTFNNRLVAAYACNENSGSVVRDFSGYGNTGSLVNGTSWAPSGKFGGALVFDGSNDLVNVNDANCLDLTTGMTIEAWVNPNNLVNFKTLLCKENGTSQLAYLLGANNNTTGTANQRPFSVINTAGTNKQVTGTTKLPVKVWSHIAATYNGFFLRLFINGNEVAATQVSGSMPVTNNLLRIGGSQVLGQYFNGLIDEVRIYNRALTKQEILVDMATPITADNTAPTVSMTAPAAGNVTGVVNVSANATDNMAIAGVQFLINDTNLGAEDLVSPFTFSWNSATVPGGTYNITARARDAAGNITTSAAVAVTVVNNNPVISNISVTAITPTSAIVNWSTNIPTNSQVLFGTTTSYGLSTLVDSTPATTHSRLISGLVPATLYNYQVKSAVASGNSAASPNQNFTTVALAANLGTLNNHTVRAYPTGSIVPWTPNPGEAYHTVMNLAWNYMLNTVPNDPQTGKPAYYSRSYIDPNTQAMVDWPHNPAGLYGMLIESAIRYYPYSGSTNVMKLASDVALWHLDHGMTLPNDNWPSVPYASGDAGSLTYNGADVGNQWGEGDGDGYIQPDKIAELGNGWLMLYKFNGNPRFMQAAIQAANVLSAKVRNGTVSQSPWPYRVNAHTGAIREEYCSNIIPPIELFDELIASGLGDTAAYRIARNKAWSWMMTYPIQNNIWAQYFEDVSIQGNYSSNLNQLNAMMVARYLLEHPQFDPAWESHVRGLISWVESKFGQASYGSTIIKEQIVFHYAMGSHTARYASINALLYEKTGDLVAKEKAYRSFNWATYMCRPNGVVIDGPEVNNEWFTDGYGDYIRHFMVGLGAVPEWAPANQSHLLRSTSVVKNISYGTNEINYTTYDGTAVDVLLVNFNPGVIKANGVVLPKRTDLTQPGWTLDPTKKILKIYHQNATEVSISAGQGLMP